MKITVDIEDRILEAATFLTGISDKSKLATMGLEALIMREVASNLGGKREKKTYGSGAAKSKKRTK